MGTEAVASSKIVIFGKGGAETDELERLIQDTWDIPVTKLHDSPEGLRAFHDIHPDLVVMDHKEAAHILQGIRADAEADGFLPSLVLISEDERDEKDGDVIAGATEFLTTPIDPAEALLRIHNLLSLHEAWHQMRGHPSASEEALRRESLRTQLARLHGREQVLVQQNRLHGLGAMATGIAHDFNDVLSTIIGATEQLLRDEALPIERRREFLKCILSAAENGAGMVHGLREFHRPSDTKETRILVDLNGIIEQAISLARPKWMAAKREVTVCMEAVPIPAVSGDPAELREMLDNLISNSIDAMPGGGTIWLQTRGESGQIVLEVRDSGAGMSERVRRHCLEPFFTTKGGQGRTGMGLAAVHGIAERHGALMELESEAGHGTTFRFRFHPAEAGEKPPSPSARTGSGLLRIMVVDDEPVIAEVLAAMLNKDGHEVTIETDPHKALQWVTGHPLNLVITDKSMPLMEGDELAAAIKAACPSVKVMMVTGYGTGEPPGPAVDHVLGKPVGLDSLRQAVAETCATSAV
jgi:signal transduction histidine kinase